MGIYFATEHNDFVFVLSNQFFNNGLANSSCSTCDCYGDHFWKCEL